MGLSWWHIVLVVMVFVLLFGVGRISGVMGDMAKGLKTFKRAMTEDDDETRPQHMERDDERPRAKLIENKTTKPIARKSRVAARTKGSLTRKSS
jgi:sec-independent protein translocase protein TatA